MLIVYQSTTFGESQRLGGQGSKWQVLISLLRAHGTIYYLQIANTGRLYHSNP